MRDHPLSRNENPKTHYGHLPRLPQMYRLSVNINNLDIMAEKIAEILKIESERDFSRELELIEPFLDGVVLNETFDVLGVYDCVKRTIVIDREEISKCASDIFSSNNFYFATDLEKVVACHEDSHALHHLANDPFNSERIWEEFSNTPSYLKEILAQLFTYHYCHHHQNLEKAFFKLEEYQPVEYRLWRLFRYVPKEILYWQIRDQPSRIEKILLHAGCKLPLILVTGWHLRGIAKAIANDQSGKLQDRHLAEIVKKNYPYPAICFPGHSNPDCLQTVFFFSLKSVRYTNRYNGHFNFDQTLQSLVTHMEGLCGHETKQVIVITDNWDADSYERHEAFLDALRGRVKIRFCLVTAGNYCWINL